IETIEDPIRIFRSDTSLVQSGSIPRAQLWWPNGSGPQPLYEARVSLVGEGDRLLDRRVIQFGVRDVEAHPCDGAPPDTLPYCLTVNGRRTWIKGWNWTPVDQLYGDVAEERY